MFIGSVRLSFAELLVQFLDLGSFAADFLRVFDVFVPKCLEFFGSFGSASPRQAERALTWRVAAVTPPLGRPRECFGVAAVEFTHVVFLERTETSFDIVLGVDHVGEHVEEFFEFPLNTVADFVFNGCVV